MMDPNNLPHHVYLHKDHKYKLKLGFHAAPSNPKAFSKAIRDELNILKFTYCSDLNGLIMGFGKISSNELIPADIRHCISVVVNVDVYIFRPPVGSIIEAIVNQTSDNHVSCLVHNIFNVSIVRPENEPYDQWSGSKIKKDDKIDVKVLSFDLTKKLPHITGEIIKKKDNKCYDSTDIQDSSTKSSSSKNIVSDFTKSFNKNTASPSKSSSSDSEITEMTNITTPKISADKSIKTSPLSINTTIKHSEKVDLTVNSLKLSSSDSESSDEMINIMTSSAIFDDKPVSSVTTNTIIQQEDTAESAPELSDSDSEFSSKIKAMLSTFKEEDKSKSTKTASHIRNINNNKHIESPLFSSTPILNSEHSVNNINLIRNKQKEQLKKHLAKNSTEKQNSLVSVKESNQFDKDKLSQSLNILKNNNDNSLKVFADSVNSNKNLVIDSKVNQNISRESGSNINDSELEQKSISVNNSFSKKLGKSTKKTKKHKKSNVIVNAILKSINTNKSNANISKHLVDSNNRCIEDDKEENTVYTQHKHKLESKILDEEILNNCKNSNEQAVKNSLTLSLSTKNIKKKDTPQKKDTDNSKNQIKDKKLKKSLNTALSMISDSDSNCSRDLKLAVKDLSLTTDFNENIKNETSSSDDEIYSKLRQNISKTQINTNHLNEKPKSQSLPNYKVHTSSDESDSSSKLFFKTPKISSKLIKSNKTKNDSVNMSEPDSCKKSNDNNLLSNEKIIKKDKKRKNVNEKPVHPRLSEKIVNKMDIINQILDNDSNSDNEKVKALKHKISEEKRVEVKNSRKKPTLNVSKTNKEVSNPFLKVYTTNVTNTSADEETVDINLTKSKKKSSGKKDIIPLVNDDSSSDNEEDTALKNKTSDEKQIDAKNSRKKPTLNVSKTNKDNGVLNKEVSNPFLKVSTTNLTNSSADEETVGINLTKSKKKSSGKKDIIPLVNDDSSSDNEEDTALKNKTSDEKQIDAKNSRKKPTLNVSKTNKDNGVLNKEISKPFLKVSTTNLTNSSADEETVGINLTKSKKKSSGKKDIIPLVNDDSSSDNEEVTALKNKTSDEKQIDAKNSRKKPTLNVSKTNKDNRVLNKEVSNPFLKVSTTNLTNSSADKETVDINLTKSKKKSSGKKDIIPLVNDDSSSDNEEVTALKNKTSDEKQIDAKNSRKKPTLNVSKTNKDNGVFNKEVSNPFLKVSTTNLTNSSADEETVDINLTKSKKKSSGKKDIIPLVNDDSSSDNEEVTALKNKTSDEKQIDAKNSRKKPTLNVSKTNKDNRVLNKEVSNPFLKVSTTNLTNSSADKETVDINLTKSKKKSSGKKDIIPLVNDDSSSDNEEVTALKNKTSDEKQIDAKNSRKKPTLNVSKTNKDNGVLNKEVSNPFLKVYTTNLTNSSSDEETIDINLTKSKKQSPGKKDIIPLANDEKKKNILINQLLASIKRKNKNEKSVSQTNLNTSKSNNKLLKNDKLKKDKSLLNTKNEKDVLNNLNISIGKPNLDRPNLNCQKVNLSQLNTHLSSYDSTDDEKDVIKKILKKQKFKKTKNAELLEQTMKSNIPTELNKLNEIKEKLHKKSKSQKLSMTAEVKNDDIKKKKKKDTKDFFLNSISALDDSLIDHPPSKKKKKDHSLNIEPYDSKDKSSDGNLSEVKIKKKKNSKHKDVNLNDVTVKDKKKESETLLESVPKNIQANEDNTLVKVTKKKKKSNPVICESQSITTDKQSKINNKLVDKNPRNFKNTVSSKKKTKKLLENQLKSFMETQDTAHLNSLYNFLSAHLNDKS